MSDLPQPRTTEEFRAWLAASQANLARRLRIIDRLSRGIEYGVCLAVLLIVLAIVLRPWWATCS